MTNRKTIKRISQKNLSDMVLEAIEEKFSYEGQWDDEVEMFMDGIRNGEALYLGDKTIGVEIFKRKNDNDPRFVVFEYGDNRLRDDHFQIQHSRRLTELELKDIRDYMARNGMVTRDEFDREYGLNIDDSIYETKYKDMNRKQTIRLTESQLKRIVAEAVNGFLAEGIPDEEDVPVYDVLTDDFSGDWKEILTANLYNRNNELVGTLRDMHFVYIPSANRFQGDHEL